MQPEKIKSLQEAIKAMHGCESRHVGSVPVHEIFKGEAAWHGNVQIFDLIGHEKAQRAYAWQFTEQDETKSVAVLEIPPIDSAQTAVAEAIAAQARQK
jgi:hypothetical protein